jgi:hypothetical protein
MTEPEQRAPAIVAEALNGGLGLAAAVCADFPNVVLGEKPNKAVDDPAPKLARQCFIVRDANGRALGNSRAGQRTTRAWPTRVVVTAAAGAGVVED